MSAGVAARVPRRPEVEAIGHAAVRGPYDGARRAAAGEAAEAPKGGSATS
jgi:hypothetical protein